MDSWSSVKLTECLENIGPYSKIPKKMFLSDGAFPIVSQEKNLVNGYWNDDSDVVAVEPPLVLFGDHTQTLKYIDFDFVVGADGVKLLKPRAFLNPRYLYYYLMANPVEGLGYARHYRLLKELVVRFPNNVPEQKRIVSVLDETFAAIDTAIANTEKILANARELFESYLNQVFTHGGEGWTTKKLGDLALVQSGGTPLRSNAEYWGGEIPWYSSGELNHINTAKPERTITPLGLKNSNAKLFPTGSLLIGIYDTAALKMSILDRDAAFNQAVVGVKPNDDVDLNFVLHAINADKKAVLSQRRGVRQKNLSLGKIRDIDICVPSLLEQKSVCRKLTELGRETDNMAISCRKKISLFSTLKQSLLQSAFAGRLTANTVEEAIA